MYLAVLGRERDLSLAELESLVGSATPFGECALVEQGFELARAGGVVKLAKVIDTQPWSGWDHLKVDRTLLPTRSTKTIVGVSFYGPSNLQNGTKGWAFNLKKELKSKSSIRIIVDNAPLTAAQLKFNEIPAKGFELIIAVKADQAVLALTEAFQDIDWYSKRDYDRPKRSAKVGMLPPKLAQIMINLSKGEKIYDPFCGTGVVLQEALLMGKSAAGSDLEPKMIEFSTANLKWLADQIDQNLPTFTLDVADATTVKIPPGYSIVSEGYLGPPLVKPPDSNELAQLKAEANALFQRALKNWSGQLRTGARVVLAVPCWKTHGQFETLSLIDQINEIGYNLVRFKHADSRKLIYARPDQIVGRQLLVLESK